MKIKNVMLFIYDFPHKKTQDFIFRLIVEGYTIEYCIAAPWKKLNIRSSSTRIDHKHEGLIHPRIICKKFKIKYMSCSHTNLKALNFLKKNPVDLYIIAGARIFSKDVINASGGKILNIHPGMLPDIRGLDTFLWSINHKKPLGISSHFITSKIDAGLLIYKEKLPLYADDTPFDITLRLLEYQSDVLIKTLSILKKKDVKDLEDISQVDSIYNSKMTTKEEKLALKNFKSWLNQYAEK